MKCPKCGYENKDGAKFCQSCGAPMAETDKPVADSKSSVTTADKDAPAAADKPASDTEKKPSGKAASASDPADKVKAELTDLLAKAKALPKKTKYIAGGVAAAIIIAVIAFVVIANDGPSTSLIEQDIKSSSIAKYSGGTWADEGQLNVDSIKVTHKEKQAIPATVTAFSGMKGDVYSYTADVKLSNDQVSVNETVTGTYYKTNGKWEAFMSPSSSNATYTAKKGPSEDKVKSGIGSIISMVKGSNSSNDVSGLYKDADISVTSNDMSNNTATVVLHCEKETDFSSLKGDFTAKFNLNSSGAWELADASASDGYDKPDYSKLVGTWTGKFKSQTTSSHKCFGAQGHDLKLRITSVDNNSLKMEGSFDGLAHYHAGAKSDANSSDGDTYVTNQTFTMALSKGSYWGTDSKLSGSHETPETQNGSLKLSLEFGSGSNSNEATCILETDSAIAGNSWFPPEYWDTYTLTKDA